MDWIIILAGVMLLEGIGPLFFPKKWQALMAEMAQQDPTILRRIGGALVTAGVVLLYIFSA